ncbi:unnamed protein product [Darwinula stevensoni]|uniref:SB domain-containing protein n=1 Tax=Darwinula stevensoni TaxID=69355 RepID=A0A7R8XBU0_9CRUS|nr:unnamed protein product [Darwinula stevensoni]CAG0891881.1 unnamed protein product [Darwinula stevensoni]
MLKEKEEELDGILGKSEKQEEIDVDEAVTPTTPLYRQLFNLYAEENATQDAIYYLGEARRRGIIDIEVFLKHVRSLSRQQFRCRALMQKCREKAGLAGLVRYTKKSIKENMPLEWLFGRRMTPEEMLRKNQRALNKAMRDLDRERMKMEGQEKKIINDIKKMAKDGQMDAVKIMAKDLVRTRRYVKKFILMRANIQAVSLKIQTLKSQNAMAQAMKGVTKAMQNMNRQLKLPQIQQIMQEFEKQSEIMDMKEELLNDTIDDAMGDEDDEEESDAIVSQILDELGLQLTDQLSGLPQASNSLNPAAKVPAAAAAVAAVPDADADLQARLDNLRRE